MITEVFKTISLLSLSGSVIILLIMLLKPFTEKFFGSVWQYYIWLVAILGLLCPFSPKPAAPIPVSHNTAVTIYEITETISNTQVSTAMVAPAKSANTFSLSLPDALAVLWLVTAIILFIYKILCYIVFIKKTIGKQSVFEKTLGRIKIYRTAAFSSPLLAGIIRPVLLIPKGIVSETELNHVLMHELMHYKRCDIAYKWLTVFIKCMHWFNPLVYVLSREIDSECEISCDAMLTQNMKPEEKKSYMNTVLSLIERRSPKKHISFTFLANNKHIIKKRFKMITQSTASKLSVRLISAASALIICFYSMFTASFVSAIPTLAQKTEPDSSLPEVIETIKESIPFIPKDMHFPILNTSVLNTEKPLLNNGNTNPPSTATSQPSEVSPEPSAITTEVPSVSINNIEGKEQLSDSADKNQISKETSTENSVSDSNLGGSTSTSIPSASLPEASAVSLDKPFAQNNVVEEKEQPSESENKNYISMEILNFPDKSGVDTHLSTIEENRNKCIKGTFNFEDGATKLISGITPDENGNITIHLISDSSEIIQVELSETTTQKGVWGVRVPSAEDRAYVFTGLDSAKEYNINLYSPAKESWIINSKYIIY